MADQILGATNAASLRALMNNASGSGSNAGQSFVSNTNNSVLGAIAGPSRDLGNIQYGAVPQDPQPVESVEIVSMDNNSSNVPTNTDLRVTIKVPTDYVSGFFTRGSYDKKELGTLGAIIFPYTPTISFEHKAEYTSQNPTHSNYSVNFYKSSSVGDISISGLFTVQNNNDAQVYLSTITLLRALTKMRFSTDSDAGSPPPICRLNAYGSHILSNIPVAISSFKTELPNDVDFYQLNDNVFGNHLVPTKSTISITCKVMYSRQEMLSASVSDFLSGNSLGV